LRTGINKLDRYLRGVKRRLAQSRVLRAAVPPRSPKVRVGYEDLDAFRQAIKQKLENPDLQQQLIGLSEIYYKADVSELGRLDPFSDGYRNKILELYKKVTGNSHYDAMVMEQTLAADNLKDDFTPIPYRFQNSEMVGEHLSCYAWILSNLSVHAGADILEYGPGEGQLCIFLARMGCNVHAIDIETRFLNLIQKEAQAVGVGITIKKGVFGEGVDGKLFDRIIFFEAFHHCFDHFSVLLKIRELLKPDGFVCFSGEPVIPEDSDNSILVPYPWGLRLDGDAMRSITEFGWMELGYSEPYFLELLGRCGYSVERRRNLSCWRADLYIARKFTSRYPIERDTLISTYTGECGWHSSEGTHRWTGGDARLPLPVVGYETVTVVLHNLSPKTVRVDLSCSSDAAHLDLASGEEKRIPLKLSSSPGTLRIRSGTFRPTNGDTRTLGVAVKSIEFA